MWIFSIFTIISNFILNYTKGFTAAEIMERRLDGIQTTLFTILIVTGFKPIFKLMTNTIVFIKQTIINIFFPNKKLQTLEIKNTKQEHQEQLLLQKLEQIKTAQEKTLSQIEQQKHKVAIWQSKKERKRLLKSQKNNTPIGKENQND
ncbi:MAG: hypothetical protein QS2022_5230 [Candidatus Phytoplasma asteris]|uniref:Transmembrane protein n=1 Tax='Chrysanthemum coronarium' phytoplasma TaxID=1520703 RepID=A0ABQ0J2M4_9MOLU|nr:hypothetical protein ['Chrysanthemum coronarium' phytoplasma]TKA87840.1 MAG: hypothetical protein PLY_5220 [Periwinkle leaf yellowing phytoplasma]WEX19765.1 MAG: hypothetical protein QS2022_5230 [Candidatus Phytoplasma asteris]GAK73852.1 putative uncharacterized protein ['Chrysanthemum coronarium' phytoplasma]